MTGLSEFQAELARLFFSLPASDGFLLAGGGALLASGLSTRPTHDLDFFGQRGRVDISAARDELEAAVADRGWTSRRVQDGETFVRLQVTGDDEVLVDLAIDVAPGRPPVVSMVGPTFDPEELAGRKLVALFDRAEARDFADVYVLAQRFGREVLLVRAEDVDRGVDRSVLAGMMRTIDRFADVDLLVDLVSAAEVRTFFHMWADELAATAEE